MILRHAIFSSFMLLPIAGPAAAACDNSDCLRIGTYNIKLLGSEGGLAKNPAHVADLAARIDKTMDIDVVVLTEINIASDHWKWLKEELVTRGYKIAIEASFGGDEPTRQQHVVVGYRSPEVQETQAAVELPLPKTYDDGKGCKYDSVRPPVAAYLRAAKFDFVLIGAHLKSQSKVEDAEEDCDDDIRRDQAERIVKWISEQAGGEKDYIVVGDINSEFAEDEFGPFRSAGFSTAMVDLPPWSGKMSYLPFGGQLIDHVLYKPNTAEALQGTGFVYKLKKADSKLYGKTQSDHVPVSSDFTTTEDDD